MTNSRFGAEFGLLVKRRRAERGLSQDQLAAILWPEKTGPKDHPNKPLISRLESGKTPNPQERTVLALCEALGIREDEVNALRLAPPPDPHEVVTFLARIEERSKSDLEDLARHYGEQAPQDRSRQWLLTYLREKAETIAALAKRIKDLEGLSEGIDNIRAEASRAILDGRLDDARRLLDGAREVRQPDLRRTIEANATLMELSAEIDLIEGKADSAFTLFSAAADSFAALNPVEVARRRRTYAERLFDHGTRYGGPALPLAIRLLDRLLEDLPRDAAPSDWAAAQSSLANACRTLGERTNGPPGSALLSRAVAAHEDALQVVTRADHPVQWATTMQNFASAIWAQGTRTAGEAGTALLSRAIAAYVETLQVFTRADHPVYWAKATQNLAIGLHAQGTRTAGEAGTVLISRAVAAFEEALQVRTPADHPVDWAMTMQNLAIALRAQGERTAGETGTALLSRAVAAYEQALEVRTRADHPVDWAGTMQNIAGALFRQGERTAGDAGTALFSRAVEAYQDALQVFTRADHPVHWAMTQGNLANCHTVWAQHPACEDPGAHLRQALNHVQAALTVYDLDHMPYYHEMATRLRDRLLAALAE